MCFSAFLPQNIDKIQPFYFAVYVYAIYNRSLIFVSLTNYIGTKFILYSVSNKNTSIGPNEYICRVLV